ncbi:MAG TPA: hypothetical protein PLA39_03630 [Methanoculleus sp.]|nr:hypothetical protein [Methanoculleus sp.]
MMPEALPPQTVPPAVYTTLEGLLFDRAIVWGEGCRARTIARRRGQDEIAAWLEAHPTEVAAGWQAGFLAGPGTDPLTRESLRSRLLARGPIIPDEVPEPGCVPAPVEVRPSPREKPRAPGARQSAGWF